MRNKLRSLAHQLLLLLGFGGGALLGAGACVEEPGLACAPGTLGC